MIMLSKFSNFPDELNENDELREYELSGSDCILLKTMIKYEVRMMTNNDNVESSLQLLFY